MLGLAWLGLLLFVSSGVVSAPARWTAGGPTTSTVSRIVANPARPGLLYAISSRPDYLGPPGLFVTNRVFGSWTMLPVPEYPSSLAIDPRRPDRLLVPTGRGIEESLDGGFHWSLIALDTPPYDGIAFDPTRADLLYGATGQVLLRSVDAGKTWSTLSIPGLVISVAVAVNGMAFAVSLQQSTFTSTLFRSADQGQTWSAMPSPGPSQFQVELDPVSPGTLYAIAPTGIFRSTDGGGTWEPRGTGYAIGFAIDPRNPATLYAGALRGVLWKSVDAGATWQPTGSGLPDQLASLLVDPFSSETLYAGLFRGGLFVSSDSAATWLRADRGLMSSTIGTLSLASSKPGRILAGTASSSKYDSADLYLSDDGGRNWAFVRSFWDISALAVDPSDSSAILVGSGSCKGGYCSGAMWKSADGGQSWSSLLDRFVNALVINPGDSRTILAETWGINGPRARLRSRDSGATWETLDGPKSQVLQFVFDPSNFSVVYAATAEGVFRSADEGTTWTSSSFGLTDPSVSTLAIDPQNPRVIYAGTKSGLFKSSDGAGAWQGTGFTEGVTAIAVDPVDPLVLCVSSDSPGLFRSADGGETWSPVPLDSSGLLSTALIVNLAIDSSGHSLHAATDFGVWDLELRAPVVTVAPRN
jgi:photosystem II stability/assembly factor-like uncharacterized protein